MRKSVKSVKSEESGPGRPRTCSWNFVRKSVKSVHFVKSVDPGKSVKSVKSVGMGFTDITDFLTKSPEHIRSGRGQIDSGPGCAPGTL